MWAHELCTEVLLPATGSHPGNPRLERLMKKYLPQDSSMVQLIARESQRRQTGKTLGGSSKDYGAGNNSRSESC